MDSQGQNDIIWPSAHPVTESARGFTHPTHHEIAWHLDFLVLLPSSQPMCTSSEKEPQTTMPWASSRITNAVYLSFALFLSLSYTTHHKRCLSLACALSLYLSSSLLYLTHHECRDLSFSLSLSLVYCTSPTQPLSRARALSLTLVISFISRASPTRISLSFSLSLSHTHVHILVSFSFSWSANWISCNSAIFFSCSLHLKSTRLCHTYEWVMSHICMSHVTNMYESRHTCEELHTSS